MKTFLGQRPVLRQVREGATPLVFASSALSAAAGASELALAKVLEKHAGPPSAEDPTYTVVPQRGRLDAAAHAAPAAS